MSKTIVILSHKRSKAYGLKKYAISDIINRWRNDGHNVIELYGIDKFAPADLCVMHVDLSVVPDEYLGFANQYPVVINQKISDIRKSQFSRQQVSPDDNYQGEVIVKTDLNFGGWPEKLITKNFISIQWLKAMRFLGNPSNYFLSQTDYKIFNNLKDMPEKYFLDPTLVVEKFLPECLLEPMGDVYCLNYYKFFGSYNLGQKLYSYNKIVTGASAFKREVTDPHPDVIDIRYKLGMDYGKLDYTIVNGEVILLDVSKTVGAVRGASHPSNLDFAKLAADRLHEFCD